MKKLIVVESPAKSKTIEKFLGKGAKVVASMGHVRDLPKSKIGVDLENNFEPSYVPMKGKEKVIKALKEAAKSADEVYIATDPDREGEAIAFHIAALLGIDSDKACRVEFNEITEKAVKHAMENPHTINAEKVEAQQARRILDRIVGYKLSPLLWKKVRKGLSAGRVQSVVTRIICEREREIQAFIPEEYWTILAKLQTGKKEPVFSANFVTINGKKASIDNKEQADEIVGKLEKSNFTVADIKRKERKRNPYAPFITSTLQQNAAHKCGFTSKKTMSVAQSLYEGVEVGVKGAVGLITYMRTDSTRIAEVAQTEARDYILQTYGADYLPAKSPFYGKKSSAKTKKEGVPQDAHEAIRPTHMELPPEKVANFLSKDQLRLYTLIWQRFIASQMLPALYDTLTVEIKAAEYGFRANGSVLKFAGHLIVYGVQAVHEEADASPEDAENTGKDVILPPMEVGQSLLLNKLLPEQHFTEPPPRYNEASLIKFLEENGIGRPSTYAPIIDTIQARGYVEKQEKRFFPTELGFVVTDLLKEHFQDIVDISFTAGMEKILDDIAEGEFTRQKVLSDFYLPFAEKLKKADSEAERVKIPDVETDEICEKCGRNMVIKRGRFGQFLACPGFPDCRNAKPILKAVGVSCPLCGAGVVERVSKKKRKFYGCEKYPACDFVCFNPPLKETCSKCGSFKTKKGFGKEAKPSCANPKCEDYIPIVFNKKEENAETESSAKTTKKKVVSKKKPAAKTAAKKTTQAAAKKTVAAAEKAPRAVKKTVTAEKTAKTAKATGAAKVVKETKTSVAATKKTTANKKTAVTKKVIAKKETKKAAGDKSKKNSE